MSKIVLYLADGTTLDIRLARERMTIGRRADNDVCLPYPAVSGEHAAIVTILSDSFLEDLGSTNGTLVNGKPVAKHFLRDRDQIDIGRQKLVYVADESVQLEAGPQSLGRLEARIYGERVEAAKPPPSVVVPDAGALDEPREIKPPKTGRSSVEIERFVAKELATPQAGNGRHPLPAASARSGGGDRAAEPAAVAAPEKVAEPVANVPAIRVLTGPNAGREMPLDKEEMAVGRVGIQVAAVRRIDGAFRLVPLEGTVAPSINGTPIPADGQLLKPGDYFEVAGVRLEMIEHAATSSD